MNVRLSHLTEKKCEETATLLGACFNQTAGVPVADPVFLLAELDEQIILAVEWRLIHCFAACRTELHLSYAAGHPVHLK